MFLFRAARAQTVGQYWSDQGGTALVLHYGVNADELFRLFVGKDVDENLKYCRITLLARLGRSRSP